VPADLVLDFRFNDAERDCSTVLALQNGSKNVKAWFRRAQARIELGKHGDAKEGQQYIYL